MIEKVVADLKNMFSFKNTTVPGDVVLIVAERISFAVVTSIERDHGKKAEWWFVGLQFLSIPPQRTTWTLREPQFTGQEIFSMGGEPRFMAALAVEGLPERTGEGQGGGEEGAGKGRKPFLTLIK